eukprot:COSAG01_NODE_6536_length_3616_cov_2.248792_1_plen_62_part_00
MRSLVCVCVCHNSLPVVDSCGMVTALDHAIGTVVDALKNAKVYNESVFIIHADNVSAGVST